MYGDDGEYERERMYESAGLDVFLRSRSRAATATTGPTRVSRARAAVGGCG